MKILQKIEIIKIRLAGWPTLVGRKQVKNIMDKFKSRKRNKNDKIKL